MNNHPTVQILTLTCPGSLHEWDFGMTLDSACCDSHGPCKMSLLQFHTVWIVCDYPVTLLFGLMLFISIAFLCFLQVADGGGAEGGSLPSLWGGPPYVPGLQLCSARNEGKQFCAATRSSKGQVCCSQPTWAYVRRLKPSNAKVCCLQYT